MPGLSDLKQHPPSVGGTLDAIRERMKSIQAAAAVPHTITSPSNGTLVQSRQLTLSGELGLSGMLPSADMEDKSLSGLQARMERLKSGGGLELEISQR